MNLVTVTLKERKESKKVEKTKVAEIRTYDC